jgi:hypothetical protein
MFPVFAAIWLVYIPMLRSQKRYVCASQAATILAVAWALLWGCYGLAGWGSSFAAVMPRSQLLQRVLCVSATGQAPVIAPSVARLPLPLPPDYVIGLDRQAVDMEGPNRSYLAGQWTRPGVWYYYLYGIAVKEPCGTLALFAAALMLYCAEWTRAALRPRSQLRRRHTWAALLLTTFPTAILLIASWHTGLNEHLRYVMVVLPFLYVFASGFAASYGQCGKCRLMIACGLVAYICTSSAIAYPHSLSYFNEVAGGPRNGIHHLSASNIDWGQDLLALANWKQRNSPGQAIYLAYAGRVNPRLAGIEYKLPPHDASEDHALEPGWYAISVSFVQGRRYGVQTPEGEWLIAEDDAFTYFKNRRPTGRVGFSINLYRID